MENKKLGQEPVFASITTNPSSETYHIEVSMSKRFYAACAAMQGILSNQVDNYGVDAGTSQDYCEQLIAQSYQFADELLKQENG